MPEFSGVEDAPLMGIFLVGVYQEALGHAHNLFGDTHSVNVRNNEGDYLLVDDEIGDTGQSCLALFIWMWSPCYVNVAGKW